ncbi:hypothetical protein GCM10010909_32430 [Acidocella aquatica]|uniref:Photosynthesis system II assembly factor Ycf48/Hcf136-like domain-containing protein n=1 Tax=Acidocella aquatica TaxID=1922313 RepID=A0ABQ6AB78_9PROT|nr:YCF48-related protein [Acidocella aquatica]GLR68562.1 hypothetical protein GCM10010909_32430 [Acidocella aquatica]
MELGCRGFDFLKIAKGSLALVLKIFLRVLFSLLLAAPPGIGLAATGIRNLDSPAIKLKAPDKIVLIAITRAGNRLVAVGEHGGIAYSDDNGIGWTQAAVPVDVTLTSVAFVDAQHGWAAGHYGVILHTNDGGLTWQEQLNGLQANQLTMDAAQQAVKDGDQSLGAPLAVRRAQFFLEGGPDKPFFSILATSPQDAMVFGAYRMVMRTQDGGKTWQDWSLHIGDRLSHNLYDVATDGNSIFIAAETGLTFVSTDGGQSFPETTQPTDASLFAVSPTGDGGIFVCGVAGRAALSEDGGQSWTSVFVGSSSNLTSAHLLPSGILVVAAESGRIFVSRDHGRSFTVLSDVPPMSVYDFTQAQDDDLVAVGSGGVFVVPSKNLNKSN